LHLAAYRKALSIVAAGLLLTIGCSGPISPSHRQIGDVGTAAGAPTLENAVVVGCLAVGDPIQPSASAGTFAVSIVASCLWSVSSDQPWLTTSSRPTTWAGIDTITYAVAANTSATTRNGRLTVTGGGNSLELTLAQPGSGVSCTYALSQATATVPAGGGSGLTVALTAGCAWTATSDQPWLTITSATSGTGNATISYAAAANSLTTGRTGNITVTGSGGTAQLTVNQTATPCSYSLLPTNASIPAAGGNGFTVALTAGCAWTATSDQPWLTIASATSGTTNAPITYTVAANASTTDRTGHITVTGSGGTAQLTVNQSSTPCTYVLAPTSADVPASGANGLTAALTAGCAWTVASDQPWLTIASATSGNGNATITYAAAANATTSVRVGHLTVTGSGGTAQLTVTQRAECTYTLVPPTAAPTAAGGGFTVALTAGCAWTASSDQPWLTITAGTSGSGSGTITYSVAANGGTTSRTGHIAVTGIGGTAQLTVTQSPPSCTYVLSPTAASVPTSGGSGLSVALTAGCAWTASSDQTWLGITSATSGSANATIFYAWQSLVGNIARTAHITVTGTGGTAQLTVTQGPPANVIVSVSPNPVGHSSTPIADPACAGITNSWFYTETFSESRGVNVRITQRVDRLDGMLFKQGTVDYAVPGNGSLNISVSWCLTPDATRTMQTTFTGTDANGNAVSVPGPAVTLLSAGDSAITVSTRASAGGAAER
jgi:hypothetical protein